MPVLALRLAILAAVAAGPPPRAAAPSFPADGPDVEWPQRIPGGVVAGGRWDVVVLRTPEGGVEAVDARTGASLWSRPAPARALLGSEGRAYVLAGVANALRVVTLEARTGRTLGSVPLPAGTLPAWAGLGEALSGRTQTTVAVGARLRGGVLEVGLEARQVTYGGIGVIAGPEAHVIARVDVARGTAEVTPGARLPSRPLAVRPPAGAGPLSRFHARDPDERIMRGAPPPDVEGVLAAAGELVGFERKAGAVVVHRFDAATGALLGSASIVADADAIWPTLDRRHVALRRARDQRRVDVYGLRGGPPVATVEGALDIAVGPRGVYWTSWEHGEVVLRLDSPASVREQWSWRRTLLPREGPPGEPIP